MAINIYSVIKRPVISGKANELMSKHKKIMLEVHLDANKAMVKEAVEKIFDVKVENINMQVRKGKNRRFKGRTFQAGDAKRAIVTLKPGYSIGMFEQQTMGVPETEEPADTKN